MVASKFKLNYLLNYFICHQICILSGGFLTS